MRYGFLLAALALASPSLAQGGMPGQLTFDPSAPQPGAVLAVEYTPGSILPDDGALDLRARLRTPDRAWPDRSTVTRAVAVLEAGSDGVYRGRFALPDSVAFALFAVSTVSGDAVDTNLEAGWPLLTYGPDGLPTVAAYSERVDDLGRRDFRTGARVARAFTEDHPARVEAWSSLSFYESVAPTGALDSLALSSRIAQLDQQLSREATPDLEDAYALTWLAGLGTDVSTRWASWLIENAPAFPGSVRHRVYRVLDERGQEPTADRLAALDAIYLDVGAVDDALMDVGLGTAIEAGDHGAAIAWA
ncbi:hypothetical protein, partial [Rubrivirga sp.]|uniref:hypothetical protein n=1 Tax=Rubrivirga sp. TaxID=1885344 RepID=UPI003C75F7B8